jgi:hypothetical protein
MKRTAGCAVFFGGQRIDAETAAVAEVSLLLLLLLLQDDKEEQQQQNICTARCRFKVT